MFTSAILVWVPMIRSPEFVARIRPGSSVLDIGTGSGALGRHLQGVEGCVVDGVTYNEEEADLARPHYRSVVVMDLEHAQLGSRFQDARYDVVVCADVLEHLRNAEAVLKSLAGLLKPAGVVIVSVPNVTHLGVVLQLWQDGLCVRVRGFSMRRMYIFLIALDSKRL